MSGIFITFEGVEGAGKTTQIALLREALTGAGYRVFTTREPGGEPVAEAIRAVVLGQFKAPEAQADGHGPTPVVHATARAELLLFLAARAQVVEQVIKPHIEAGEVVICDRYIDSTTAYQGYARGHDLEWVRQLNHYATGGLRPTITVLLDVDPESGLSRQADRNRMEAEPLTFHRRVREGFLAEARLEPERFVVVDGSRDIEQVRQSVINDVFAKLTTPG